MTSFMEFMWAKILFGIGIGDCRNSLIEYSQHHETSVIYLQPELGHTATPMLKTVPKKHQVKTILKGFRQTTFWPVLSSAGLFSDGYNTRLLFEETTNSECGSAYRVEQKKSLHLHATYFNIT